MKKIHENTMFPGHRFLKITGSAEHPKRHNEMRQKTVKNGVCNSLESSKTIVEYHEKC